MILDAEQHPKSPRSPVSSQSSPTQSTFFQYPHSNVSYSTFPSASSRNYLRDSNAPVTDITSLLGHSHAERPPNDEQPPAYDEIRPQPSSGKARNRFWTRCATVLITILLAYTAWDTYKFVISTAVTPRPSNPSNPGSPPPKPPPSNDPPPSLPPPPPEHSPGDSGPDVPPTQGRVDLCRPWAYSLDAEPHLSTSDNQKTDNLIYTVPSLAPIHIETDAICPDSSGRSTRCTQYGEVNDAIIGKLQVIGADVALPSIEISFQHGSEQRLKDVSVCLIRRPRATEQTSTASENYKWVLGVYVWKSLDLPGDGNPHASLSMVVKLPRSHVHDLSTQLNYFTQLIGPAHSHDGEVSFGTLSVEGSYGHVLIQNVAAAVVQGRSLDSDITIEPARISESIDVRSTVGIVACNLTLVHVPGKGPVSVDLHSDAGTVEGAFELEYPSNLDAPPQFDITAYSQLSRAMLWVTDRQGTSALRAGSVLAILPALSMNLTSQLASAQALIPPTYQGSLELSSRFGAIITNDHASALPGRTIRWFNRAGGASKGEVQWDERNNEAGKVHIAAEYAAVRLLFLGLHDDDIEHWPSEGDEMDPRWRGQSRWGSRAEMR
ncbi:hypothetical protein FS749_002957 [Ceratobasidium sp. UAMH 11750]|nr:hypothetical protein FS749_002957 [Ceratobasidium sp. UAMH 11750]